MKNSLEKAPQGVSPKVDVSEFGKHTIQHFVQYLHGNGEAVVFLDWREMINLYKISFKFQVKLVIDLMIEKGKNLISKDNIYEAIIMIDSHDINEWLDCCCSVLLANKDLMKTKEWEDLIETNPKTMARLFQLYFTKSNNGWPILQSPRKSPQK
ncbi:uncharacterized protein LOC130614761 [Hydractinia symbiolongicarpus]|uniref:uncharacterized protein LOC130614761 n=1 Tax=Hydractinia symbiolongicarpus TaxID=13093 RepID=UPI00254BFBE0|nr:uncharacterized protein LOC130614761 [Hydractinia symbiolongicarpus]